MKKVLLTLVAGLVSCSVFGQGGIVMNTFGGAVDAPITDAITGQKVVGTAYLAQLYYGPAGAAEASLVAAVGSPGGVGVVPAPAHFSTAAFPGYILTSTGGGNRYCDPTVVAPGAVTTFQIRAWQANLGATWEEALGTWSATTVLGKSALIQTITSASAGEAPKPLTGLAGFNLVPVPEPSVIALGAIGLVALLWRRRK